MRVPLMTPLTRPGELLEAHSDELAAQRAYNAFVEAARDYSPPVVQSWSEMHPRVRQCWIKAAAAARASF